MKMKQLTCDVIHGMVGKAERGHISIQFADQSGQEWEVDLEKLELFVLHTLLGQAIARDEITPNAVLPAAREKYQHLFDFPDS